MFFLRLISTVILLPLFIVMFALLGVNELVLLVVFLIGVGVFEWRRILKLPYILSVIYFLIIALFSVVLINYVSADRIVKIVYVLSAYVSIYMGLIYFYPQNKNFMRKKYLHSLYLLLASCNLIASLYWLLDYASKGWLLFGVVLIFCSDISAYIFGKLFGKNALVPKISPGKTIEGAFGAFVLPLFVATLFSLLPALSDLRNSYLQILYQIAFFLTIASMHGDLIISVFKRAYEVKDSGNIIPGHGGILDRLDSIFTGLPVFLIMTSYLVDNNMVDALAIWMQK